VQAFFAEREGLKSRFEVFSISKPQFAAPNYLKIAILSEKKGLLFQTSAEKLILRLN
jgi:hypothetical protein